MNIFLLLENNFGPKSNFLLLIMEMKIDNTMCRADNV